MPDAALKLAYADLSTHLRDFFRTNINKENKSYTHNATQAYKCTEIHRSLVNLVPVVPPL
jgi:hypothetical protein